MTKAKGKAPKAKSRDAAENGDDAKHLLSITDQQHMLLLDVAAGRVDRGIADAKFGELQEQFREVSGRVGKVAPPFPWGSLEPWIWEAKALGNEEAASSRLSEYRAKVDALVAVLTGESRWEIIPFHDAEASFASDISKLDGPKFDALQVAIEEVLTVQGSALIGTKWVHKIVNANIYEFRVDNDESQIRTRTGTKDPNVDPDDSEVDVLVRAFFMFDGQRVILLLSAYDKGEDDSIRRQNREIDEAKKRARRYLLSR